MEKFSWSEIEKELKNINSVEGGNSNAKRGFVNIGENEKVFVKWGIDKHTEEWASKEIKVYNFLAENSYPYVPRLLSTNANQTGFALEVLVLENGWDWSNKWNDERLTATLKAIDVLAAIKPEPKYKELLKPVITDEDNGWKKLGESDELQKNLEIKLKSFKLPDLINNLSSHIERSSNFKVRHDIIVHDDIRADNCPWNEKLGQVKLVDWNWIELGDRRIDLSAMLVHVQNSGFDVMQNFSDRLDAEALHWMAGFWLYSASKPIWEGGPESLRDVQLKAGVTALTMALGFT